MTEFVIPPPPQASIAVAGSTARFPVRRIYCVGRNYAAHAREMGGDDREPPFFFSKPSDAAFDAGGAIPYPPETSNLHHEIELVVALSGGGSDVPPERALDLVFGYAAGLDLTRRDMQAAAKDAGRPWDWAKGFDRSGPVAPLRPAAEIGHPKAGRIWLKVNGQARQEGNLSDLIWSVPEVIATISRSMELKAGDLIFTGTPSGVGPVVSGEVMEGGIEGVGEIRLAIS